MDKSSEQNNELFYMQQMDVVFFITDEMLWVMIIRTDDGTFLYRTSQSILLFDHLQMVKNMSYAEQKQKNTEQ